MNVKCIFIEPLNTSSRFLRRYSYGDAKCPSSTWKSGGPHDAQIRIEDGIVNYTENGYIKGEPTDRKDPRFPKECPCGYHFTNDDAWQLVSHQQYTCKETGEIFLSNHEEHIPVGAIYDARWLNDVKQWTGPDGNSLHIKTPGGIWNIDSRASNCGRPEDDTHKCWVRHGEPPNLHVDKNGDTCNAGAGSIAIGEYHGFLHNGYLTDC